MNKSKAKQRGLIDWPKQKTKERSDAPGFIYAWLVTPGNGDNDRVDPDPDCHHVPTHTPTHIYTYTRVSFALSFALSLKNMKSCQVTKKERSGVICFKSPFLGDLTGGYCNSSLEISTCFPPL
jgi:hypothetical protein